MNKPLLIQENTIVIFLLSFIFLVLTSVALFAQDAALENAQTVPVGGNSWQVSGKTSRSGLIKKEGIVGWKQSDATFKSFFRITNPGTLKVWVNASVPGKSTIEVKIAGAAKTIKISNSNLEDVYAGEWKLKDTGYVAVELKGLSKEGEVFANIADLKIAGTAINEETRFVKNDEGNFFYWGRRGPSVHLNYDVPKDIDVEYYYNEVTVPEGDDIIGSYYMANGFSGGYFGIQVNSETERRVLFSVWSPFVTDNPEDIPEDEQIKMLKKGKDVYTGEFGNEGSGGQSFLRYNWKAGNTYKFLLKGEPIGNNHTAYTAWFFTPEDGTWQLIASFSRPKTNSWLTGFHSFLENFNPDQGIYERKVLFGNQWIADKNGSWTEITGVRFSADNTARMGYRLDYAGGLKDGEFYLRNCGFFDDYTPIGKYFERPKTNQKPMIDFSKLP